MIDARALVHLHSLKQIHRDVKTDNVLLASPTSTRASASASASATELNMLTVVKVSDFGTVREDVRQRKVAEHTTGTGTGTDANRKSHGSTSNIIGTLPYMPTEYFMMGHVSTKTDSFAYGIVLVQLMSNLSGSGARGLIQLELEYVNADSLGGEKDIKDRKWTDVQLQVLAEVVELCTQEKPKRRGNISDVVGKVEGLLALE